MARLVEVGLLGHGWKINITGIRRRRTAELCLVLCWGQRGLVIDSRRQLTFRQFQGCELVSDVHRSGQNQTTLAICAHGHYKSQ